MYNIEDFKRPVIKENTRVFRPKEFNALLRGCPKIEYKTILEALLYTGMRYIEMKRFQRCPLWFDDDFVHMPRELAVKKEKRTQQERWVRLNQQGKMAVRHFIGLKNTPLPSYQSWVHNLRRWADHVNLDPKLINVKSTRKSWESWLMFYYPHRTMEIAQSQGHTTMTSLQHYMNSPFTDEDKLAMRSYVEGW